MKSKERRSTHCNNCDSKLEEHYNFCPVCGQSNTDNNVTFWVLIREFMDNYLGIESKMAHSIMPFLCRPGKLTNRFQEGKIKHFIHPVRLYLVLSVFYFFVISFLLDFDLADLGNNDFTIPATADITDLKNDERLQSFSDSLKIASLSDSLVSQFPEVKEFNNLYDSLVSKYGKADIDSLNVKINLFELAKKDDEPFFDRVHRYARDKRLTDDQFLDSLTQGGNWEIGLFNEGGSEQEHLKSQIRRVFEDEKGFRGFVLGNLPLMMFLLIPLFAAILKLIYVRREHLYIKHIVHALHIHSFAYLVYGLGLLIMFKLITESNFPSWNIELARILIGVAFFVGVSTYVYISFLNVYKQGWFKTLIKFNIVGFIYSILLQMFFYTELAISFWYF